jgi:hypothetical protein
LAESASTLLSQNAKLRCGLSQHGQHGRFSGEIGLGDQISSGTLFLDALQPAKVVQ